MRIPPHSVDYFRQLLNVLALTEHLSPVAKGYERLFGQGTNFLQGLEPGWDFDTSSDLDPLVNGFSSCQECFVAQLSGDPARLLWSGWTVV